MIQTDLPILEDGDLRLRAANINDVDGRLALRNSPEIQHMFGLHPDECVPLNVAMAEDWVNSRMTMPYCWVVEYQSRLIGDTFFHNLNKADRRGLLALGILDPSLLGQGIGTRMLNLLLDHGFGAMGLHRIGLRVVEYNARAIAAYKKVGFVIEGRERQSARVGDVWHDDIIMGLLADDHANARAA